jgi:hypothetical protein
MTKYWKNLYNIADFSLSIFWCNYLNDWSIFSLDIPYGVFFLAVYTEPKYSARKGK